MSEGGVGRAGHGPGRSLPDALDGAEKRYWRELWSDSQAAEVDDFGLLLGEFGPVQATVTVERPAEAMANLVLGAAAPGAVEGGHLAEAIRWVESRAEDRVAASLAARDSNGFPLAHLERFMGEEDPAREVDYLVPVTPGQPGREAAERWLSARGLAREDGWARMARDAAEPVRGGEGREVVELGADEVEALFELAGESIGLGSWADALFFELLERRRWHCYVALDPDGWPRAFGAMMVDGPVAVLGLAPDLGEERREAQLALHRRRILDAREAGCGVLVAETAPMHPLGRRTLREAGFREAHPRPVWRGPAR